MIRRVYLEITNLCNLHCPFCTPVARSGRMMSREQVAKLLPQIRSVTPYLYLHVRGEPLTHPEFEQILSLCDEAEMKVQLVTNGTLLSCYPDLFSHPSLRKLSVSLQSVQAQDLSLLSSYLDTIDHFMKQVQESGHPIMELRFWRSDQNDLPAAVACMQFLKERYPFESTDRNHNLKLGRNLYLTYDNMFTWPDGSAVPSETGTCHGAVHQIAILSDGTLIPCCMDAAGVINLGNVFETPLSELLQSERYLNMKNGFCNHQITEPFCRTCSFRKRFG